SLERQRPGQQLEENHTGGVHVGSQVDFQVAIELFGRHVVDTAHHLSRTSQAVSPDMGDTKIHDLRGAVFEDDNIGGLDVAMYHAALMGKAEAVADLHHDAQFLP